MGGLVDVCDASGQFIAAGLYSAQSQIRVRAFQWEPIADLDAAFWERHIQRAIARRASLCKDATTTCCRIIASEADFLPGLVVDRYGSGLVLQVNTVGIEKHLPIILDCLEEIEKPNFIYARVDDTARSLEGLSLVEGLQRGGMPGNAQMTVKENGLQFVVDFVDGHKTGFYMDQRENRESVAQYVRPGDSVLNAFCYTGGFSVYAARAGAKSIVNVDSSAAALKLAEENMRLNGLGESVASQYVDADVFSYVRKLRSEKAQFDVIILDPPKLAGSSSQVDSAARAYKDMAILGFQLLKPGGFLALFSCSGHISEELFQKIAFSAASDAKMNAVIVRRFWQASDHPVLLSFPESLYLKGLLLQKTVE